MTYHEVQRFSVRLLGLVWLFTLLLAFAVRVFVPDRSQGAILLLPAVSMLVIGLVYLGFNLRTDVRNGMLSVRLAPFPALNVPVEKIRSLTVVEYKPLRDFGGWGWRVGSKGTIYSASGNQAVQLCVEAGGPIFVGSAAPHELAAALRSAIAEATR